MAAGQARGERLFWPPFWQRLRAERIETMANKAPMPQPGILDINPYLPGESSVASSVKPIKLSSNETPLGPSPKAIAAFKSEADQLERYPDGAASTLRKAIAEL